MPRERLRSIVANLCGPSNVVVLYFSRAIGTSRVPQKVGEGCQFFPNVSASVIVRIAQCLGQELMARATHTAQIDLRFGDSACELLQFGISVCPSNLAGKRLDGFGHSWIGIDGQAQSMPHGV